MLERSCVGVASMFALLSLALPPRQARAQAAGAFYLKASTRTLVGSSLFGPAGETIDLPDSFQDHQLRLYGTYALSESWAVVASLTPFGVGVQGDQTAVYFGGGDAGLSWRLLTAPVVVSVLARVGGRPGSASLFRGTLQSNTSGSLQVRVQPIVGSAFGAAQLQLERGLGWGWVKLSAGGQVFSNEQLDPVLEGFAQLGFKPGAEVFIDLHLSGWYAFGDLDRPVVDALGSGQTRYLGLGLGLEWWLFDRAALTAGIDIGPIARANAVSPSLSIGVALRGGGATN